MVQMRTQTPLDCRVAHREEQPTGLPVPARLAAASDLGPAATAAADRGSDGGARTGQEEGLPLELLAPATSYLGPAAAAAAGRGSEGGCGR